MIFKKNVHNNLNKCFKLLKPFDYSQCAPSKIEDKEVKNLLKIFTDSSIYFKAVKESGMSSLIFQC